MSDALADEIRELRAEIRRLAALIEPRACADTSIDVPAVLTACYRAWASSVFTVDDARTRGLVLARDTRAFGRALSLLAADGLPVAGLVVVRCDTSNRHGRLWMLRPAG